MTTTAPVVAPAQLVDANHFQLSGNHLHIVYAPFVEAGLPFFSYQDGTQAPLTFRGADIQVVDSELGKVVSVPIRRTIDTGSTTFSIVLPRVRVTFGGSAPLTTGGVTAIHNFSVVQAFNRGQLDHYTFTALMGTASHVLF
jgi:hypothetical protein